MEGPKTIFWRRHWHAFPNTNKIAGILGHELHARLESDSKVEPGATKPWSDFVVSKSFCGWQRFSVATATPTYDQTPIRRALAAPWSWKRAAGSPGPERVAVKHGKFLDVKQCPLHQRPFHEQTCRHEWKRVYAAEFARSSWGGSPALDGMNGIKATKPQGRGNMIQHGSATFMQWGHEMVVELVRKSIFTGEERRAPCLTWTFPCFTSTYRENNCPVFNGALEDQQLSNSTLFKINSYLTRFIKTSKSCSAPYMKMTQKNTHSRKDEYLRATQISFNCFPYSPMYHSESWVLRIPVGHSPGWSDTVDASEIPLTTWKCRKPCK